MSGHKDPPRDWVVKKVQDGISPDGSWHYTCPEIPPIAGVVGSREAAVEACWSLHDWLVHFGMIKANAELRAEAQRLREEIGQHGIKCDRIIRELTERHKQLVAFARYVIAKAPAEEPGDDELDAVDSPGAAMKLAVNSEYFALARRARAALEASGVEKLVDGVVVGIGYPADWPRCPGCGRPALDGHITCGDVRCDEGSRR